MSVGRRLAVRISEGAYAPCFGACRLGGTAVLHDKQPGSLNFCFCIFRLGTVVHTNFLFVGCAGSACITRMKMMGGSILWNVRLL